MLMTYAYQCLQEVPFISSQRGKAVCKQEVDRNSFSQAHVVLSALHRGEDAAFQELLRRLWRLPRAEKVRVEAGERRFKYIFHR